MEELENRRADTKKRIAELQDKLKESAEFVAGKACVYATGSFGRREASRYSDLDLFIVGKEEEDPSRGAEANKSLLIRLDEICVKADLIKAARQLGIPDFDGDGRYLVHYSVSDFTKTLGTPEDDVTNTFTARLLLLLESCPLVEDAVYHGVITQVIEAYWRDYEGHEKDFIPGYLANDILRLWRAFCVNYEARTESKPDREKAKRKLKNYKLKHSRLLTCYSALLYLLAIYGEKSCVSPDDALEMIKLTPTQRLEWLLKQERLKDSHQDVKKLLSCYDAFLETTNVDEKSLIEVFMDKDEAKRLMDKAHELGDIMFAALNKIGGGNRFHRLLVV